MINITIDEENLIAIFEPEGKLTESDFKSAVTIIDPYINQFGKLNGLIISTQHFPGWNSFAALSSHLSFVKNHQKNIARIACVTDSAMGTFAEHIARHFIAAEIKMFPYGHITDATQWIVSGHTEPH